MSVCTSPIEAWKPYFFGWSLLLAGADCASLRYLSKNSALSSAFEICWRLKSTFRCHRVKINQRMSAHNCILHWNWKTYYLAKLILSHSIEEIDSEVCIQYLDGPRHDNLLLFKNIGISLKNTWECFLVQLSSQNSSNPIELELVGWLSNVLIHRQVALCYAGIRYYFAPVKLLRIVTPDMNYFFWHYTYSAFCKSQFLF